MAIWPLFKRKAAAPQTMTVMVGPAQARQSYITPYGNTLSYLPQWQDAVVMKAMRQAIPIIDTAADKLVKLTGSAQIVWESTRVQQEWDTWIAAVHITPLSSGLNTWLNGHQKRAITFGTGASEIVPTANGRDIYGFQFIPTSTLRLKADPSNPLDVIVAQQQTGKPEPVVLDREFICLSANEPADDSPYGQSLFAQCPFIAELLIEMAHAMKQDWNRVGAPSFAITVDVPQGLDASVDVNSLMGTLVNNIKSNWIASMESRKEGKSIKDFFGAGSIKVQTIGTDGNRLEFETPWRAALEQIISVTHLPPWMLGMHWSTTERLSEEQAQALEDVIIDYQEEYTRAALWAADWWARVRGYASAGREISWPSLSIRDRVEIARADMISAQAQATRERTAKSLWQAGVYGQQEYADAVIGEDNTPIVTPMDEPPAQLPANNAGATLALSAKSHQCGCGTHIHKAETPNDDRIARAIRDMHSELRGHVRELRGRVFDIFDLPVQNDAQPAPFSFTPAQESLFNEAVDKFLTRMVGADRSRLGFMMEHDASIQKWDMFAHGIGVQRGIEMTGAEASAIIGERNAAATNSLLANAFDRLSDGGRLRLENDLGAIKDSLQQAMADGISPIDVARDLSQTFDSYEQWQFERLARTEIAFAQVQGQLNEFEAQGVDISRVNADPPPWHPHCMCDLTIEQNEVGNWIAKYEVSTTACEVCQSYAEG